MSDSNQVSEPLLHRVRQEALQLFSGEAHCDIALICLNVGSYLCYRSLCCSQQPWELFRSIPELSWSMIFSENSTTRVRDVSDKPKNAPLDSPWHEEEFVPDYLRPIYVVDYHGSDNTIFELQGSANRSDIEVSILTTLSENSTFTMVQMGTEREGSDIILAHTHWNVIQSFKLGKSALKDYHVARNTTTPTYINSLYSDFFFWVTENELIYVPEDGTLCFSVSISVGAGVGDANLTNLLRSHFFLFFWKLEFLLSAQLGRPHRTPTFTVLAEIEQESLLEEVISDDWPFVDEPRSNHRGELWATPDRILVQLDLYKEEIDPSFGTARQEYVSNVFLLETLENWEKTNFAKVSPRDYIQRLLFQAKEFKPFPAS